MSTFLAIITIFILIIGMIRQSEKDRMLTKERKDYAISRGECNFYRADQTNIHIPTGKRCMSLSLFSPDHKSSIDEYIERGTGILLGGQKYDRDLNRYVELSAKEVEQLKKEGWK